MSQENMQGNKNSPNACKHPPFPGDGGRRGGGGEKGAFNFTSQLSHRKPLKLLLPHQLQL
jgi:hypothetical protein